MDLTLSLAPRLGLVGSEAEGEALGEALEPLIVGEEPMALADIVEDELILALPQVPMHPVDACPGARLPSRQSGAMQARQSPFAVLAQMKARDGRN